jgi:PucR C-terminal helix-turn-helix domain/GGDEF-like domain
VLGSIWAIDHGTVDAAGENALLSGARLAALHLLQVRDGAELERRARAQLLQELLDGRTMPSVVAARLGLHTASPVTLLGIRVDHPAHLDRGNGRAPAAPPLQDTSTVADLARVLASSVEPAVVVLEELGTVYLLVSGQETSRTWLRRLADEIVARSRSALRADVGVAVGATVDGLADLGRSRADVDLVLRVVAAGTTALVEDVRAQIALLQLTTVVAADDRVRLPAVDDLLNCDDSAIPYAQTLLTYLDARGEVTRAAAELHVHENTMRYRLRRLQERFGIDLDDPDTRLVAWLQLRTGARRPTPR